MHAGTVLNYVLDKGLNKATILFPGVACFALAVVAGALTHVFNEEHLNKRKRRFDDSVHRHAVGNATIGFEHGAGTLPDHVLFSGCPCDAGTCNLMSGHSAVECLSIF